MAKPRRKVLPPRPRVERARRGFQGLSRRRDVSALARLARRRGVRVWVVGGALRDLLLDRPVTDIDVAVDHDAGALAADLEAGGYGKKVVLSATEPRVFRIAFRGSEMDIAQLTGGSIAADLRRRDFTVNAMAWELGAPQPLDPLGGVSALAGRRLRLVAPGNLGDDPLRIVRAARLMATHELLPDRAVTIASREVAPRLVDAAPERLRTELRKLLESNRARDAVEWLHRVGALTPALGLTHLPTPKRVWARVIAAMDDPTIVRAVPATRCLVRICLIGFGIGFSSSETAQWLAARRFSREEAGDVAALLDLAEKAARARTSRDLWTWIRDSGSRRPEGLLLLALLSPALRTAARRLAARRPRRRIRITGGDIIRWLGITPGPVVGKLLREIEVESLRGTVQSRAQARRWLEESRVARSLTAGAARADR